MKCRRVCLPIALFFVLFCLFGCGQKSDRDPTIGSQTVSTESAPSEKDLRGNWLLAGEHLEVYSFDGNGRFVLYEMDDVTSVREQTEGSYTFQNDRLVLMISGQKKVYNAVVDDQKTIFLSGDEGNLHLTFTDLPKTLK